MEAPDEVTEEPPPEEFERDMDALAEGSELLSHVADQGNYTREDIYLDHA